MTKQTAPIERSKGAGHPYSSDPFDRECVVCHRRGHQIMKEPNLRPLLYSGPTCKRCYNRLWERANPMKVRKYRERQRQKKQKR